MQTGEDGKGRLSLFLALESSSGMAALLLDAQGVVEYANQKALMLLDCASADAIKVKWREIAPFFDLPPRQTFPSKPYLCKAEIPSSTGLRRLHLELHALDEGAGFGHFAVLKDPAVLDQLERELLLASERRGWAIQREGLLHDLKGILNSMQISLELLTDADAEPVDASSTEGRRRRRVAVMKEDLMRMDRALRLLPGAEGPEQPAVTDFDIRDLLKEIFASLRQLVRRNNVELKLDLPEVPMLARGRRAWIKLALFNVAVHRLNAMRAGGLLTVEVASTDQTVVVTMRNDVPDRNRGLIREGYPLLHRGQSDGGGNDLQVAHFILESHGGAVEITTNGADGTAFVLRLPR